MNKFSRNFLAACFLVLASFSGAHAQASIFVAPSNGSRFVEFQDWSSPGMGEQSYIHFADVTGDGLDDMIDVGAKTVLVWPSDGTGYHASQDWTGGPCREAWGTVHSFADVTGDGKADFIVATKDKTVVRRSTGSAFRAPETWTNDRFMTRTYVDVNGDHKADGIFRTKTGVSLVRLSDGSKFLPEQDWTGGPFSTVYTYYADVTGDGLADAIGVNKDQVLVRPSNGSVFLPSSNYWLASPRPANALLGTGLWTAHFADVTGDGLADMILYSDKSSTVQVSNGSKFLPERTWRTEQKIGGTWIRFGDVNGDGMQDEIHLIK
jgi:hypothetical protein